MLELVGLFFLTLIISYLGVTQIRDWAKRRKILDIPNERSSHTQPTPLGGGLVIVAVTLSVWLFYILINPEWLNLNIFLYILGAVLIAFISWLDDLYSLPNWVRFSAHCIGAILGVLSFGYWQSVAIPFIGQLNLTWLGLLITFLWIVGLTNAFNFMDGIDGIAGGQAVIAGLGWVVLSWLQNQPLLEILGLLLVASSLGFLGHNWPPARIFMGDVGSAFLGYTFALLPIMAGQDNPRLALASVLLVWPFVFDTFFTFLRRLLNSENVFTSHRSHLYQRLVIAGVSHQFVSLAYAGLAAIGATLAVFWFYKIPASGLMVGIIIPSLCVALWRIVVRFEYICSLKS
jgi:UDP-N-acetylmuramyl pentapeptide phosphotransferase/UDP-N-acetylglucosamine-1-phosphate transferase